MDVTIMSPWSSGLLIFRNPDVSCSHYMDSRPIVWMDIGLLIGSMFWVLYESPYIRRMHALGGLPEILTVAHMGIDFGCCSWKGPCEGIF